ncbi:MAG: M3 family oligoendopeptidase [bacterium]|nr:M3 family oligoendopeptidase [bacterium]
MTTAAPAKKIPAAPTWDLDSVFPGGSSSEQFKQHRLAVKQSLAATDALVGQLPESIDSANLDSWVKAVLKMQTDMENIELILAFAGCLSSANVKDTEAMSIEAEGDLYYSEWQKIETIIQDKFLKLADEQWRLLVEQAEIKPVAFYLNEVRDLGQRKMSVDKESLALDLAVNGYHAWGRLYDKMSGDLKVQFEEKGQTTPMSLGQLATKMSDPDRSIRKQAFEKMTASWETQEELAAITLNSIAGYRLSLYKNRGWDDFMYEPLHNSRMEQKTLDTMWSVISRETPKLKPFIEAKKKLLGIDKFSWYDEFAPVGKADTQYTFEEAGQFIIDNMKDFSTDMADFVKMALDKRWVEAEDRADKRGGAFCTGMGHHRQSRVFMTYGGSFENLLTLAHELGHAYHGWVLKDSPYYATHYPMNLAETASIFAETLVTDAALAVTEDPQTKLMLLEQKIQSAYVMFCDIHSRYIFERSFYNARKEGVVGASQLRELMVAAQKKAFGPLLDETGYHPLFWCSKLHFYITGAAFYNFPYTFGYLFSGGVYDRAKKEGSAFAEGYRGLLADTGSMTTEDVAKKHLKVDLTEEEFWNNAVARSLSDIDEFVKLAGSL